ncbi:unnamed protein product [Amoebophrya sp. A120]|nr:unnamed protein product [Amoebophrya sp. A120]|eukprot:GSA120T00001838001.1
MVNTNASMNNSSMTSSMGGAKRKPGGVNGSTTGGSAQSSDFAWNEDRVTTFVRKVPMFRELGEGDVRQLVDALEVKHYPANSVVFRQHEPGNAMFIVLDGEAFVKVSLGAFLKQGDVARLVKPCKIGRVVYPQGTECIIDNFDATRKFPFTVRTTNSGERGRVLPEELAPATHSVKAQDRVIASCRAGDYFGEQSLLQNAFRQATVVAGPQGSLTVASLSKERFLHLQLSKKIHFPKRKAVLAAHARLSQQPEIVKKAPEIKNLLVKAMQENQKLHALVPLTDQQCEQLAMHANFRDVKPGEILCHEGDPFTEDFFIVETGLYHFSVTRAISNERDRTNQFELMQDCGPGGSFGEVTLLHAHPCHCTVQAMKPGRVWCVSRQAFKHVLHSSNSGKLAEYMKCLHHIPAFDALYHSEKEHICEAMYERHFLRGEHLLTAGQKNDTFFILLQGSIVVQGAVVDRPGTYFGEQSLLDASVVDDTVSAHSPDVQVACLTKHDFEQLLEPLASILKTAKEKPDRKPAFKSIPPPGTSGSSKLPDCKRSDLRKLGLLGCGGFGAVTLEQHKTTGECYALKQLSKGYIVQQHMENATLNEKNILMLCDSPFVVQCYATFNTDQSLWFLLEPALGGELYATYSREQMHGFIDGAKFYSASVVYAFEHLHAKYVVYRDLKPENLMLTAEGRCKLTDMGLAKQTNVKTYTTCGTPDYFAPEIVANLGHHYGVDWWTLGILIHELLSGHAPFEDGDPSRTYAKINRGVQYVKFPYAQEDPEAKNVVMALLQHNPVDRLPMSSAGGVQNLKDHPWYKNFDWKAHYKGYTTAPYHPIVKSMTDMSNFRAREADLPPQMHYTPNPEWLWDKDFATNPS